MAGIPSPTDNPIVEAVRAASKRILISSSVIHDIISRSNLENPVELCNVTLYVLSFADFFRFDDVSRIRRNDVIFNEGFMVILARFVVVSILFIRSYPVCCGW